MSELENIITECDDILANADNTPFRPVVLLRMVQRLAKEVQRIDQSRAADSHPAQEKGQQRSRARAKPKGHFSDAG